MYYLLILILLNLLSSCVRPVYDGTTYGMAEFVADSSIIAKGKESILEFKEAQEEISLEELRCEQEECVIDGDVLQIILHSCGRPDYAKNFNLMNERAGFVIQDGKICLPYIEPIEVANLSLNEIKSLLQEMYTEQVRDVCIYIAFKKKKARIIQIIGTTVPYVKVNHQTRLYEVLAKADMHPYANLYKSYLVRNEQKIPVDFYRLIHEGDEQQNIVVQGGDQIYIAAPEAVTVMVTGEVCSHIIPIPNGFISLLKALANVGGIPFTGDKSYIHVIRGELKHPKIYMFSWDEIVQQPHHSLLLMTGDIVYITERPITQWNRLINQLDLSVLCFRSGYGIYKVF